MLGIRSDVTEVEACIKPVMEIEEVKSEMEATTE
jgi:hypothetical protein